MIKQLNKSTVETVGRPVRILQFGEGNFLRAFVDWQIDIANEKGVMDAGVAVCQPIIDPEHKVLGMIDLMHRQDNMYHVYLEGIENKRPKKDVRLVKSIMDSFNPYVDYAKYEAYFLSPELKITISNTTEAGIRYEEGDDLTACPPKSYPAKMTALLYKRTQCPSARTAILSASRIVDRRCATINVVRPFVRFPSASCISFSEILSKADVASSRTITSGSRISALAIAIRCLCPPESSPTFVFILSSSPISNSARAFWKNSRSLFLTAIPRGPLRLLEYAKARFSSIVMLGAVPFIGS